MGQIFVFPGQGSQAVGMGAALAKKFAVAREVFAEVDEALSFSLSALMWEGPLETLTLTENSQPAIMAASIAAMRVLESEAGVSIGDALFVAGHSLGEYSALCAAGGLSLSETAKLLRLRGRSMQEAAPIGEGAMAALMGLEIDAVEDVLSKSEGEGLCVIANDNGGGQIVVSGHAAKVEACIEAAKAAGAKRALLLPVSAPFHCPLMAPAASAMQDALADADLRTPLAPIVANVTAEPTQDVEVIRKLLVEQVTGRVRWRESVLYMAAHGAEVQVEVGAGKVLSGLARRINRDLKCLNFGTPENLADFAGPNEVRAAV